MFGEIKAVYGHVYENLIIKMVKGSCLFEGKTFAYILKKVVEF